MTQSWGGDGAVDPGKAASSSAGGRRIGGWWPWWKILLAVMAWPFVLLWWVWGRSGWGRTAQFIVTALMAALFIGSAIYAAMTPRTSSPAPTNPSAAASTSESPADPHSQLLKQSDFGASWPLTVPEATATCRDGGAVVLIANGKEFAVNGLAMTWYKSMATIQNSGLWLKTDIGRIIDIGLDLCNGKRFTPSAAPASGVINKATLVPAAVPAGAACAAAFKAWEPKGGTLEPSDPLAVATLTKCVTLAEWRGGLETHPAALDYEKASDIGVGNVLSDLTILCGGQSGLPVCTDARKLGVIG